MEIDESTIIELTPAQLQILKIAQKKTAVNSEDFIDNWSEYNESYDDYNDCHGDYYDAE
ncbi:MAG: hypothetical protein J1F07_03255 [Muribaculaceae bacterium]|nr:hypothetical protein [Muribaculaceae bacterium]